MKSSAWQPFKRIEEAYRRELNQLFEKYLRFPDHATLGELVARLTDWQRVDRMFERFAMTSAERMVTNVLAQNARTWRAAATEAGEGAKVFETLRHELRGRVGATVRAKVVENADLIRTLPGDLAVKATRGSRFSRVAAPVASRSSRT